MLTDEQQALQLAFTSLEEKFRAIQEDNNDLVARWMAQKARDADMVNAANDQIKKKKQEQVKAELSSAINHKVEINFPGTM